MRWMGWLAGPALSQKISRYSARPLKKFSCYSTSQRKIAHPKGLKIEPPLLLITIIVVLILLRPHLPDSISFENTRFIHRILASCISSPLLYMSKQR